MVCTLSYQGARNAWTAATDMANGAKAAGNAVYVASGGSYQKTAFVCTTQPGADLQNRLDLVGTHALEWVQFSSAFVGVGTGLQKSGATLSVRLHSGNDATIKVHGHTGNLFASSLAKQDGACDVTIACMTLS